MAVELPLRALASPAAQQWWSPYRGAGPDLDQTDWRDDFVTKLKAGRVGRRGSQRFLKPIPDSFEAGGSSHCYEVYVEPFSPWAQSLNRLKEHFKVVALLAHDSLFVVAGGVLLSLSWHDDYFRSAVQYQRVVFWQELSHRWHCRFNLYVYWWF